MTTFEFPHKTHRRVKVRTVDLCRWLARQGGRVEGPNLIHEVSHALGDHGLSLAGLTTYLSVVETWGLLNRLTVGRRSVMLELTASGHELAREDAAVSEPESHDEEVTVSDPGFEPEDEERAAPTAQDVASHLLAQVVQLVTSGRVETHDRSVRLTAELDQRVAEVAELRDELQTMEAEVKHLLDENRTQSRRIVELAEENRLLKHNLEVLQRRDRGDVPITELMDERSRRELDRLMREVPRQKG